MIHVLLPYAWLLFLATTSDYAHLFYPAADIPAMLRYIMVPHVLLSTAVLVQAEALYGMGEFERSLVLFHRGARKRPDLTSFTRGIHKAREAIINAIGGGTRFTEDVTC